MTESEKAYQYFVIAIPETEEQAKAYFWARKALQPTLTQPNEWVSVEDRMPEPGSLIVYADVCIDEVAYGVLRVPQGKCHKVYNYWMCLSDRFNRRSPEGEEEEKHVIEITENL